MNKHHLNLLIDAGLLQRARDNGLVISKFLEVKLQEYFSFMDAVSYRQKGDECGRRDLNPSYKLGKLM